MPATLETTAKAPRAIKVWKSRETLPWPSPWITVDAVESSKPHHARERHDLLESAMRCPSGMEEYFVPLGEGHLLSLHWDPIVWLQAAPTKTLSGMEHTPLEEGKGRNSGLLCLPWSPCPYAWQCCLTWSTRTVCHPGQIPEAAKFPLLEAAGTIPYSTGTVLREIITSLSLFPPRLGGCYNTHISPTKSTKQA